MKENIGSVMLGIGIVLLGFSMTFILAAFSCSPLNSNVAIIAACYLVTLIGLISVGSRINTTGKQFFLATIEYLVIAAIGYLLTCLILDGGRLQRAAHYALIPYLILLAIIYLRWKNRTWLDIFLLRWAWLPIVVILTPVFYRAFEGNRWWQ